MSDALDAELIVLINKLNKVQAEIGGGKKENSLAKQQGKLDRFVDLKQQISARLETIKQIIEEVKRNEKVAGGDPKTMIANQSKIRTELSQVHEDWKELDTIYRLEAKKRRSKFTPEEMQERQNMLIELQKEIQTIKEMQRAGYVKGYQGARLATMEESEMFKVKPTEPGSQPAPRGVTGQRNNNMSDEQRVQLMQLKERDAQIDNEIDLIGEGVDALRELALAANEEVKLQNRMLDGLEEKMDATTEKVLNVNEQLRQTLDKARKSDKICMDIFCLLILVGMIIVVVKVSSDNQKKGN